MKKFALLGAVAALATAGGVFAAWTFTNNASYEPIDQNVSISVGTQVYNQGYGSASLTTKDYAIALDGDGTSNNNEIKITETGSIVLTYVPAETGEQGVKCTVSITGIDGTYISVDFNSEFTTVYNLDSSNKTVTVDADDIDVVAKKKITTTTELEALKTEVKNGIKVTFTLQPNTPSNH